MAARRSAQSPEQQTPAAIVASIEDQVQAVLAEALYWFPVRHHSTVAAWHLQAAIAERAPKLVLIEGPSESNALLPVLEDRKTEPPVAIYSCFQDDQNVLGLAGVASASRDIAPRWSVWYPLLEYSPELAAIRAAARINATARFIDLPHAALLTPAESAAPAVVPPAGEQAATLDESESLLSGSDFYQQLAQAGGYRCWDEGWDALFELRGFADHEAYRREMLTFCAAARATAGRHDQDFQRTLARERFMRQAIAAEMQAANVTAEETMIVCGGFHAFLDRQDATPPPTCPPGTWYTTVVPYTYFRMSNLAGYSSGNRAPSYYQLIWESLGKLTSSSAAVVSPTTRYVVSVLKAARKRGENVSAADSISIAQHARMLAALRKREVPLLDDLQDAILTCACKARRTCTASTCSMRSTTWRSATRRGGSARQRAACRLWRTSIAGSHPWALWNCPTRNGPGV